MMSVVTLIAALQGRTPPIAADTGFSAAAVERWIDGFMARAREPADIAGAVVVVVKDTSVVLAKGYGWSDPKARVPVDPARTLFRPGSISKLFAWTAVMQLVEQGRLDLDRDIQNYLDFPIRGGFAEPITLRHIMTHTAGFEETLKEFYTLDSTRVLPLGRYLATRQPARIYPPGSTPAYSNYATALAGFIVERAAGVPFERYVEERIFRPLGMARSTFRQPLPLDLAPLMSQGYVRGSEDPYPFEIFSPGPAGGLSASGTDMGRFLIAILGGGHLGGQRIIREATLASMFLPSGPRFPNLVGMGLGWYRRDRNGRQIVAHGGDTRPFHSELRLLLGEKVGIYVSFNSVGTDDAMYDTRTALMNGFADAFFPDPEAPPNRATTATAAAHARLAEGRFETSRRWETSFLSVLNLGQAVATAGDDGTLTVSSITGLDGQPKVWREVEDWLWVDEDGRDWLGLTVENGRVTRIMQSDDPATEYLRAPWWRNAGLVIPAVGGSLVVLTASILLWPVGALVRRRYRVAVADRIAAGDRIGVARENRLAQVVAMLVVGLVIGWGMVVFQLVSNNLGFFTPDVDWRLRLLSLVGLIATIGTLWLVVRAVRIWAGSRSLPGKLAASLVPAAALIVMAFAWASRLVTVSVAY